MRTAQDRFARLGVDAAPGQEGSIEERSALTALRRGEDLPGVPVDFSHGDVDAFPPPPGAQTLFDEAVAEGAAQAYTPYKGRPSLLEELAPRLAAFTGAPIDPARELILTPGTQGALFLAVSSAITPGGRVAIVDPDYFANRKIVEFFDAEPVRIPLRFIVHSAPASLDLDALEAAFRDGVDLLVISNPNNPVGSVYPAEDIAGIAALAERYGATVIIDQLYSRMVFDGREYTHLRALDIDPDRVLTLMGPSKTESLSGFRLGAAVGAPTLIERMQRLQAIVSLRAAGYNQAVLRCWFAEPEGWMDERVRAHQGIRDELVRVFTGAGWDVRPTEAGSYLYPQLPETEIDLSTMVALLREQAGVTVTPGTEFTPDPQRRVRLNFSQDRAAAVAAAERMIALTDRYRRR